MVVMDSRGKVYPVEEIVAIDELADTCFFRIAADNLSPLPLGRDSRPGSRIRIVSHPGDAYYYLSSGVVSNYEIDDDDNRWVNVTADVGQGSSGAPVLDSRANVIGQVSRTATLFAGPDEFTNIPTARNRRRRTRIAGQEVGSNAVLEPQMVFKSCVPVDVLRRLVP